MLSTVGDHRRQESLLPHLLNEPQGPLPHPTLSASANRAPQVNLLLPLQIGLESLQQPLIEGLHGPLWHPALA